MLCAVGNMMGEQRRQFRPRRPGPGAGRRVCQAHRPHAALQRRQAGRKRAGHDRDLWRRPGRSQTGRPDKAGLAFGLTFAVSARSRGFLAHPGFGGLARGNVLMTVRTRAAIFARPYKPCAVAAREHEGEVQHDGTITPERGFAGDDGFGQSVVDVARPGPMGMRSSTGPVNPLSLRSGSESVYTYRGGACPDCVLIPESACTTRNELLSRSVLIGRGAPRWDALSSPSDGLLERLAIRLHNRLG